MWVNLSVYLFARILGVKLKVFNDFPDNVVFSAPLPVEVAYVQMCFKVLENKVNIIFYVILACIGGSARVYVGYRSLCSSYRFKESSIFVCLLY